VTPEEIADAVRDWMSDMAPLPDEYSVEIVVHHDPALETQYVKPLPSSSARPTVGSSLGGSERPSASRFPTALMSMPRRSPTPLPRSTRTAPTRTGASAGVSLMWC
jgi:hypothetical protein